MDILVHRYAVGQLYWDMAWLLDVSPPKNVSGSLVE